MGLPPSGLPVSPLPWWVCLIDIGGVDVLHEFFRKFSVLDIKGFTRKATLF